MFSGGEVSSDNNISGGSSGNSSWTSCYRSAVETSDNIPVSLSDSKASSGEPSRAEFANGSESGGTEDGDKIFNTSVSVSSNASSSFEASESSATCSALSKVSVSEYEDSSCGNQFSFEMLWIWSMKIGQYIYSQPEYNQKLWSLIRSVFSYRFISQPG